MGRGPSGTARRGAEARHMIGLAVTAALAFVTWLVSVAKRDASIVDSAWSLMLLAAGAAYGPSWALALAALWAARLAVYITCRNWGHGEDRRYRAIRERNQPGFEWKSLY